ncbi:copper resistance CopC family protein [uncultured Arthrobacter sp.]|uniref:copper resistance CopC family protein n=1 Tax=uncultured Arthrobacter sp. TaxID=114050 RepID=UPI003216665A
MSKITLTKIPWRRLGTGSVTSVLALLLLGLGVSLAAAPPASAHDQLISSTPAPGERLGQAPDSISLTFLAPMMKLGYEIRVVDSSIRNRAQNDPVLTGATLTQPLPADLPEGEYQVRWRAVSGDGHPISGSYEFLVGATATPGSFAAGNGADTSAAQAPDTEASQANTDQSAALPAWLIPAGLGAVAGLGIYVAVRATAGLRRTTTDN